MDTKLDSNGVGLSIAEELTPGVLPGTPVWYEQEPNSFSDFGATVKTVARSPISAGRQNKKGTVTDLDATAGFNTDLTQNNVLRQMQGFFFADAHEKPATQPFNGTQVALTAVNAPANTIAAASGLGGFKVNHLILAEGFGVSANNGLAVLTAATATLLTTSKTMAAEASPPATARIQAVGFQFPSADVALTYSGNTLKLTAAATDLTTLGLNIGEWIFIGGDSAAEKFATAVSGYARISAIAATSLTFSDSTFAPVADAGTGKTIRIFFGKFLRNEKLPANIKKRTYQLERQLGRDDNGMQSEYLIGSTANEFSLKIPQADKITADLNFVSTSAEYRDGTTGIKAGTRVSALGEDAINTTSDVYRQKIYVLDSSTTNPTALFGYITEGSLAIKNGVTANKAIGVLGGFNTSVANFTVSGSLTAYFTTVAACTAIQNNSDVAFNTILAKHNAGCVYDIPLLGLGGGKLNVQKDQPIMIPVETAAAENAYGYTFALTNFPYLPTVAMS